MDLTVTWLMCTYEDRRTIVNMYAQFAPGKAGRGDDSAEKRLQWFRSCLRRVGRLAGVSSVAVPYGIGCGLAGGNWDDYEAELQGFAKAYPHLKVVLLWRWMRSCGHDE